MACEYDRLDAIARRTGADKSSEWHDYTRWYARHLVSYVGTSVTLLEVGILYSQSLELWRDYLGPAAKIVGVDNNKEYITSAREKGFEIFEGDQGDSDLMRKIALETKPDIIIDDGSHQANHQRATFGGMFPVLKQGGLYVIEDLHAAYWGWGGQFMQDVYGIVDNVNNRGKCEWGRVLRTPEKLSTLSELERTTMALHFYPSILFIEKGDKGSI